MADARAGSRAPVKSGVWLYGLLAYLLIVSWGLRIVGLARADAAVTAADLRGFVADAAGVAVVWTLSLAVRRWVGRIPALGPVVLWVVVAVASYEQVRVLGSPLTLDHAHYLEDPTFLAGSALRPGLLGLSGSLLLVGLAIAWVGLRSLPGRALIGLGFAAAVLAIASLVAIPVRQDVQAWRQTLVRVSVSSDAASESARRVYREPDLDAPRWKDPVDGRPDVLLLVLEGVSGGFLPVVSSAHGRSDPLVLPNLDRLARSGVHATSFVTEQRQTNRGLYALLCGQSPRLVSGEARLTEIARGLPHPPCLPERLMEVGYRTVFFEATPLSFMLMDAAMPRLGFQTILDDSRFRRARARNTWGVDDATFLEGVANLVTDLDEEPGPWLLVALTAGTHHPYDAVPSAFSSPHPRGSLPHAMAFLDEAVGDLVVELEERSRKRDLLLVVTSDESAGASAATSDLARDLTQNWGILIVHTPDGEGRGIHPPVLQSDLSLSLLDLLGIDTEPEGPGGRSLFREYADDRTIAFGNTYQGRVGAFGPDGHLVRCPETLSGCRGFRSTTGTLFGEAWSREEIRPESMARLAEEVRSGSGSPEGGPQASRVYPLAAPGLHSIPAEGHRMIFGGQYLDLAPESRVTVELAAEVKGDAGWIHVRHALSSRSGDHYRSDLPALAPGDSFELRYTFRTGVSLERLDARMTANRLDGGESALRLTRARLDVRPEPGASTSTELLERVVRRAAPPPVLLYSNSMMSGPSELPRGMVWRDGAVVWPGAVAGGVIPGPRFYAAPGSELRMRAIVEAPRGGGVLRLVVGSEAPSLLLAGSPPVTLRTGEETELYVAHDLTAALNELVTGVLLETADSETTLVLRMLEVEVTPP